MGWTRFFRSYHTEWLEAQYEKLKADHLREIEQLKSTHAETLSRAITECERLRNDLQVTRLALNPVLQHVTLEPDRSEPPKPAEEVYAGTPWQRHLAREIKKQYADGPQYTTTASVPAEGESDGRLRQPGPATPLTEPSEVS